MGSLRNILIGTAWAGAFLYLLEAPVTKAATVIGQQKFTNNSTYTADIDKRFRAYTGIDRMTYHNLTSYARKRQQATFTGITATTITTTKSIFAEGNITSNNAVYADRVITGEARALHYEDYAGGNSILAADLLGHPTKTNNPHSVKPAQVFGNHTGLKYPATDASDNVSWFRPVEVCGTNPATAIFDGAPGAMGPAGHHVFCNISAPVQGIGYDTSGLNPAPTMKAMAVQLWEEAQRIVIQTWQWWTGGPGNMVYGSGTGSTFTPSIKAIFNNRSTNNYAAVQVRYSTMGGGHHYCQASIPIALTKPGQKGDKGDSGASTFTKDDVLSKFTAGTAGGNAMYFFPTVAQGDTVLQIGVGDSASNLRLKILPTGLIMVVRPDGKYDFMYDTTTRSLRLGNYSTTSPRSNISISNSGMITSYKRAGTAVAFTLHSSLVLY